MVAIVIRCVGDGVQRNHTWNSFFPLWPALPFCPDLWPVDTTSPSERKSILNTDWKDWCWSWSSNTLATWCEELTHWKRPWCLEKLRVGGEVDNRGWDGWMAPSTQWTWVWANSWRYWRTGKPGVLQSMGSQRAGHNWVNEQQQWKWRIYKSIANVSAYRFLILTLQVRQDYQLLWQHEFRT